MPIHQEQKISKALIDAVHDIRFSPVLMGKYLAESDPEAQRIILNTLTAFSEFLAIKYDFGDFEGDQLPYMRVAVAIRDLIHSVSAGSAV